MLLLYPGLKLIGQPVTQTTPCCYLRCSVEILPAEVSSDLLLLWLLDCVLFWWLLL